MAHPYCWRSNKLHSMGIEGADNLPTLVGVGRDAPFPKSDLPFINSQNTAQITLGPTQEGSGSP